MNVSAVVLGLLSSFGKGYIMPMDYVTLLIIVIFSIIIGIGVYKVFLNSWIRKLKHPLNLRLIAIALSINLIVSVGYIYIRKVLIATPTFSQVWLIPIILSSVWLIFTIIVSIWGKQIRS